MNNQTVLIVMPAYNAEKTIREAIQSIVDQTYTNWILFVVDDNSKDKTVKIVKEFLDDERIYLCKNKKNMGAYYSRNAGLFLAKDLSWSFFTTHDADDVSYKNRLARLVSTISRPQINAVKDKFKRVDLQTKQERGVISTTAHAIFRRSLVKEVGYFENVRFGADWEYWERVKLFNRTISKNKTQSVHDVLGDSFLHKNNLTVQIPVGSKPRLEYVADTKKMHEDMLDAKKFYMPFRFQDDITERPSYRIDRGQVSADQESRQPEEATYTSKNVVVLLTWKRVRFLRNTLESLARQTNKDFDVEISNGNLKLKNGINNLVKEFSNSLNINVSHDGNDYFSFRRMMVGERLAQKGIEKILFIDDDITFSNTYIEEALREYEPKTYKSGYCWSFYNNGESYYRYRTRITEKNNLIHYCGTGISIVDATIFLDKRIFDAPAEAYRIEDLWLSYFAQHVKKWKLGYIPFSEVTIGGKDQHALHTSIIKNKKVDKSFPDKDDLLRLLVTDYGWKIKA